MNTVLKIVSLILSYPTQELKEAVPAIREALAAQAGLDVRARDRLERLADDIDRLDLYDAQERYVHLFDRTRSLSLHLFEHVHGESRDRGQAMVDLKQVYAEAGLQLATTELPDYLPAFLEYLSLRPAPEAVGLLAETVHILMTLAERLEKRSSPYAGLFRALVMVSKAQPKAENLAAIVADDGVEPDDLEALDAVWMDEEVTFGPGAATAACGKDALGARLRAAGRPAEGVAPPQPAGPRTVVTRNRISVA